MDVHFWDEDDDATTITMHPPATTTMHPPATTTMHWPTVHWPWPTTTMHPVCKIKAKTAGEAAVIAKVPALGVAPERVVERAGWTNPMDAMEHLGWLEWAMSV